MSRFFCNISSSQTSPPAYRSHLLLAGPLLEVADGGLGRKNERQKLSGQRRSAYTTGNRPYRELRIPQALRTPPLEPPFLSLGHMRPTSIEPIPGDHAAVQATYEVRGDCWTVPLACSGIGRTWVARKPPFLPRSAMPCVIPEDPLSPSSLTICDRTPNGHSLPDIDDSPVVKEEEAHPCRA